MGIKLLQSFIGSLNHKSVREISLRELTNKKIVVDISIYLYRFKESNQLIENMYLMCSIFRYYNIDVLFVFDGKADDNKKNTIKKRKEVKHIAREKYYILKEQLGKDLEKNKEIEIEMDKLRKKFVTVSKKDFQSVRELLDNYGMTYVTATKEADELCGALCLTNDIYACLTEDTDIIAYGAPRILRYFSLMKHTVVFYDLDKIRSDLHISLVDFQHLCVCAGNDYIESKINIFKLYKLYKDYDMFCNYNDYDSKQKHNQFLEWLLNNRYITLQEYHKRMECMDWYTFKATDPFKDIPFKIIKNKHIRRENLKKILKGSGFVFP